MSFRVVVFAAAVFVALGTVGDVTAGPVPFPTATTQVASGSWNGVGWMLYGGEASTAHSFSYCIQISLQKGHGGGGCGGGGLRTPGVLLPTSPPAPGFSYGITFTGTTDCAASNFNAFAGLVVSSAKEVVFTLSNGRSVTTPTLSSPPGLAQSLRFWAIHVPCGTNLKAIFARDRAGKTVARIDSHFLPHLGH